MRARWFIVPVTVTVAVTGVASCTDFDREDRIEDMRVLAIKTTPAEILYSPFHLTPAATRPPPLTPPPVDVTVEVFAYDPRGGRTSMSVQLCPEGSGDSTCRLYNREDDLLQEPASARDELRALLSPQVVEDEIDLENSAAGRVQPTEFNWTFSAPVIDFFIPDTNDGTPVPSIFPLLPRVVAVSTNLDQEEPAVVKERAFKRIPVALDLTSEALPPDVVDDLAAGLGVSLCTAPIPDEEFDLQGRAECLLRRLPNNNPFIAGLLKQVPEEEELPEGTLAAADFVDEVLVERTDTITASPGEVVQLTPVFDSGGSAVPNSVERYQVISFDIEASKIIILNRVEDLACNWYSTRGEVSNTLTAEQFTPSLGVTWSLPSDAQPGEKDVLVLVVLDQRGGTDVAEITVEYE